MKIDKDEKRRIYETEIIRLKARRAFEKEKSGGGWLWVIVVLILVTGGFFLVRQIGSDRSAAAELMAQVEQIIESVEAAGPDASPDNVWDQLMVLLEAEDDPAVLARLAREAHAAADRVGVARDNSFRRESYTNVLGASILRLGDIGGDRAADALVGLLCDRQFDWNQMEEGFVLACVISICGEPCLPYLRDMPADHPMREYADHLIPMIERGEEVGF